MRSRILAWTFLTVACAGCSNYRVDTFPKYCEQLMGVDLQEKYAPFWSVFPGVSFHGDEIRDSFTAFLNETYMEKVKGRIGRAVWREGVALHVTNPSALFEVDPEKFIEEWRQGIATDIAREKRREAKDCPFGAVTALFDAVQVHSPTSDALGIKWNDRVTVLPTWRQERFAKLKVKPL